MNNSDLFLNISNNNKRTGEIHLASSISSPRKKSKIVSKTAILRLQNLHLPLTSATTGSSLDLLALEPDRPYTIGRDSRNCEFVFSDSHVSKKHCQILFDSIERKIYILDGVFLLPDFSCVVNEFRKNRLLYGDKLLEEEKEEVSRVRASLNGIFVNGIRVQKGMVRELNAGDEVLLVCRNESLCRFRIQIGFVILGIVFKEEVVSRSNDVALEGPQLGGTMALSGHSQGYASNGRRNKRVFALRENYVWNQDCDSSRLKCHDLIGRARYLLSQCRNILNSDDPVSRIRHCAISDSGDLKMNTVDKISGQEQKPCGKSTCMVQSGLITFGDERIVALEAEADLVDSCAHNDHLFHNDRVGDPDKNATAEDNSKRFSLNTVDRENATQFNSMDKSKSRGSSRSPPGKKFYLNRLEFMDLTSSNHNVISLPELLCPVESISRIFIATFTSDILWFLSYCEIPCHLPVAIACHNTERCWSSSTEKRTSVPFPDFPNLVVLFPPFPESVAFGKNHQKKGIACHHPKLLVVQREDTIRVIVTSANLVAKQWNGVTNTIWWQDFPRRSVPDYLPLFVQTPIEEINQDSRSDFAAQLASFMASLVVDVPSQAHWIVELTKYDFSSATGHLIASVPGIHSYRNLNLSEFTNFKIADNIASRSSHGKFLGSVEASVVGMSHLFRTSADSNGAQIKKLAAFLGKSCEMLEVVLKRNTNVPADLNAVRVLVPNPNELSDGDCIQLGFLPRNIAKWVSPLWDIGFLRFSGFISREEVLAAALGGINKKVQLILHVSQGPKFSDISRKMQTEHVVALSSLIASIQRCRGLWRLQEVLGQYKWPELQESDFVYSSSSIGSSISAQFLAAFAAATGKKSMRFLDSEESDPEWGCWSAGQELRSPSIRIIFPTIERVKNACEGILPSKRILCFSEKTWQRLRTVGILHDAIPHPHDRLGHPMHVKVARRRFQCRTDSSSCGWIYCGSHNFSAAAWGRPISNPSGKKANGSEKANSSSSLRLHICNYELGIVFVFPPTKVKGSTRNNSNNMDDVMLPFVVPAPKYGPKDRPATAKAMREALAELTEEQQLKLVEPATTEEMMEEISDEEEEVEAADYVAHEKEAEKEKEDEKAYAEMLWSQVDSSESC